MCVCLSVSAGAMLDHISTETFQGMRSNGKCHKQHGRKLGGGKGGGNWYLFIENLSNLNEQDLLAAT